MGGVEQEYTSRGDLTDMLNISIKNGDIVYFIGDGNLNETELVTQDKGSTKHVYHTQGTGVDARKVFVRRDSFGGAMMPLLATVFEDSVYVHQNSFSQQQIFDSKSDVFILEMVERNIPQLEKFRISHIDYLVEEGGNDDKNIVIAAALTDIELHYVSIFKRVSGTEEVQQYQVLEELSGSIDIQVPEDESGEVYVYIFEDSDGETVMEEITIPY